jgi:hypothetical protein
VYNCGVFLFGFYFALSIFTQHGFVLMIKTQQKLMEEKGQYVYRRSIHQTMLYERIIAEKYSKFKMAQQGTAEHIRSALDLANTIIGLVISEVGPANTELALSEIDKVNHASSENRRERVNNMIATLTDMIND